MSENEDETCGWVNIWPHEYEMYVVGCALYNVYLTVFLSTQFKFTLKAHSKALLRSVLTSKYLLII